MATAIHNERLECVMSQLVRLKARRIIDLGCGDGELLARLLRNEQFERIVGIDSEAKLLDAAVGYLDSEGANWRTRILLVCSSFLDLDSAITKEKFDTAVLLESIEHIDGRYLTKLERNVFRDLRPQSIIITTPNREYNPILGVPTTRLRHPGHFFEWTRSEFASWCERVSQSFHYSYDIHPIGPAHLHYGSATQMAVFTRHPQ